MYPGCVLVSIVDDFLTQQVDVKTTPDLVMMGLVLLFSIVTLKLEYSISQLNVDFCVGRRA